ncbi:DUF6311 domain-containing protein [Devosia sp. SD17-2]|uniref:DUF6311 domain-containing protein n=1 Tax=Devosia sp. SD17-2 TaxID=2976459 RepID=UPI0023D8962D|nr:DUF6311 domain-containing protein [Devosia sp. SD17-2]WEJ32929.1 DUF6311 domain-containing protein [Devosia sp. SD17-2]
MQHAKDLGKSTATYLLAAVIGVAFFLITYPNPIDFLLGNGVYFEVGDTPQHVAGWLSYAKDAWRWPLLTTQLIAPPEGSHIALTDSIPLAALLFKPLAPFLWENFNYFGLWHLVTKIIQATGAVFLIRSLGHKSLVAGLFAAALALMSPSMLVRLQHTALMTHGVLLFALGLYFRAVITNWSLRKLCAYFGLAILAALLVHPYLVAMVFPLFLAASWDRWGGYRGWRQTLATVAIVSIVAGIPAVLLGYGSAASSGASGGYIFYSMNLLSPLCGGQLSPCRYVDATGGQYEGFNYLGFGYLLIIVLALVLAVPKFSVMATLTRRHLGLIGILVGLNLYALSGHIFLGERQLTAFEYPFPFNTLSYVFRASGRFFWVVGYAALFLSLALVLRQKRMIYLMVLPVALALQWYETAPLRDDTRRMLTADAPFDYSGWTQLRGRVSRIDVSPEYGCASDIENMRYVYFHTVAARLGVPINTVYQARQSSICSPRTDIATELEPGVLRVNLAPSAADLASPYLRASLANGECFQWRAWHGLVMCLPGSDQADWAALNIAQ